MGHGKDQILKHFPKLEYGVQEQQLGTGHAFSCGVMGLGDFFGEIVVLCGDAPLIRPKSLKKMIELHRGMKNSATVMTSIIPDPTGYGRIIRDEQGFVIDIVEQTELNLQQENIQEINSGVYVFDSNSVLPLLSLLKSENKKNEYYLTDIIRLLSEKGGKTMPFVEEDHLSTRGINDRWALAQIGEIIHRNRLKELALSGVSVEDTHSIKVDMSAQINPGSHLKYGTIIEGESIIEEGAIIGPFAHIVDGKVKRDAQVSHCVVKNAEITEGTVLCPPFYSGEKSVN